LNRRQFQGIFGKFSNRFHHGQNNPSDRMCRIVIEFSGKLATRPIVGSVTRVRTPTIAPGSTRAWACEVVGLLE
jgi:hypothetical protein